MPSVLPPVPPTATASPSRPAVDVLTFPAERLPVAVDLRGPPTWQEDSGYFSRASEHCTICNVEFGAFKRKHHCRNCGALCAWVYSLCLLVRVRNTLSPVCSSSFSACSTCSGTYWPNAALPPLFCRNNERKLRVCKPCINSVTTFRQSLESGDFDGAIGEFRKGRVRSVSTPFGTAPVDGSYPIHAAAKGGDMKAIRWLVDRMEVSTAVIDDAKNLPITVAAKARRLEAIRYFVQVRSSPLTTVTDVKLLQTLLVGVLSVVPELPKTLGDPIPVAPTVPTRVDPSSSHPGTAGLPTTASGGLAVSPSARAMCIVCYVEPSSCILSPCGHTSMCFRCAASSRTCATCRTQCDRVDPTH